MLWKEHYSKDIPQISLPLSGADGRVVKGGGPVIEGSGVRFPAPTIRESLGQALESTSPRATQP